MTILGERWFKFFDEFGLPCVVLLSDIVAVYTDGTCIIETIHGDYSCGDSVTAVIDFLGSYFNHG